MSDSPARKRVKKVLIAIIFVLIGIAVASYFYVRNYYHAAPTASDYLKSSALVTVDTKKDGTLLFIPKNPTAGFIFYQGGKVELCAYAPLLYELAENGFLCIAPQMPSNLAVLNPYAAKGLTEPYPEISDWYIGGHSLGGSMAAAYAAKHPQDFRGVVLMGSYSTADLTDSGLTVVSLYGSNDGILNLENYEKYRANLPEDTVEYVIEGGCHSYFGSYGMQKGDGTPDLSNEEQIKTTVDLFVYSTIGSILD